MAAVGFAYFCQDETGRLLLGGGVSLNEGLS